MVETKNMDMFIESCYTISTINKPLFFKFNENHFVQSDDYKKPENTFNRSTPKCSPKQSPIPSPTSCPEPLSKIKNRNDIKSSSLRTDTIIFKNISDIFFKIINPIGNRDDNIDEFCKNLDKYKHLLKTITSRHKQLHKQISDYIYNKNSDCTDMSHLNKNYITFWSKLMNVNIYIVNDTLMYNEYLHSTQNTYMVIKFIKDRGYELMHATEATFIEFNKTHKFKPWVDISKLSNNSMKELKDICVDHGIQIGPIKNKKADIIQMIKDKIG